MPERNSLAHALDLGLAEWNFVLADFQSALRAADFSRGKKWQIAHQVTVEKIVNIVLARIDPGHEG